MNRKDQFEEDILMNYINPAKIEKAPDGFTSKTMTRIHIESESRRAHRWIFSRSPIPLISVVTILLLVTAAIFMPPGSQNTTISGMLKFFSNYNITFPRLYFSSLPQLNLPVWILYTFIVVVFLGFLDRFLGTLFSREKQQH
jgi:hypothetical protein